MECVLILISQLIEYFFVHSSCTTLLHTLCVSVTNTRGQRPNESQKAVIIDMMKSVGQIASEKCPVLSFFTHFLENLTLTFDLDLRSKSSTLGSLNVTYWVVPWYRV